MSTYPLDLSQEFAGRRALVTGGSRGIGAAAAQRLLDGGATVVVAARSPHEQTPAGAKFISADLLTEAGAKALGTGISRGVTWNEFQVSREPGGRPVLELHGRAALLAKELGVRAVSLSLTHSGSLAMATVMMEG